MHVHAPEIGPPTHAFVGKCVCGCTVCVCVYTHSHTHMCVRAGERARERCIRVCVCVRAGGHVWGGANERRRKTPLIPLLRTPKP